MQLRPEGRSRGQVIIVGALVIAAIFVGLALVLNSGIYAENLSSRETTDTEGALSFTLETNEAIAEAYERTNAAGESSAADAEATFNETVDDWESAQQRRGAMQGVGVDVERTPHVGWRLAQGTDRNFTSNSGTDDWQLVAGASDVGTFELNVTRSELHEPSDPNGAGNSYYVEVNDSNVDWRLYIFQNGSDVVVHSGDPTDQTNMSTLFDDAGTCRENADHAVVDFRNESLAGANCEALNFSDDVSGSIDVYYRNVESGTGDEQVNGTYTLVVNGSSAVEGTNFDAPSDAAPTARAVVYSASYASHYGRDDLAFERRGTYAVREETYAS